MGNNHTIEIEEINIEPLTLIRDILVNWWVALLGAIGAALLTVVIINAGYEPMYTTSATFVVSMKNNASMSSYWSKAYEMAQTMQLILESNSMNKIICEELGLEKVDAEITASTLGSSNLLTLKVTAGTSKEAVDVIRVVIDNYEKVTFFTTGVTTMELLEAPSVPMSPSNPYEVKRPAMKVFLATGAGLVFLIGLISFLRDTIKREEDIEKKLDASSLGMIPYERKRKNLKELFKQNKRALLVNNPVTGFGFVESYRKLAAKVDHRMKKKGQKALVVTSIAENEGKSTVAANLAIALAGQSKRVILMEGDLRRPSQFLIFNQNTKENQEIGEYLKENAALKDIMVKSSIPNLYLILGRNCYSSSTEMVQTEKMRELLEQCKKAADYVIIDTPPVGLIGDAEVLAEKAGAMMLVTKQNYILAEDINDTLDVFRAQKTAVIGVVLNKALTMTGVTGAGSYGKYDRHVMPSRNRESEES